MQPGPKPRPTALKVIEGNPGKRPIHGNEPEPISEIPDPPDELNDDAKTEWARVCDELYRVGLLSRIDRSALAAYCQAFGRWMQAERGIRDMAVDPKTMGGIIVENSAGNLAPNPLVGIAHKAMHDMMRYAEHFGMTPSARARLDSETPRAPNKFAGLIGRETETA